MKRSETPDFWTRDISLQVPVSDVRLWDGAKPTLVKALSFLSGDRWDVTFVPGPDAESTTAPIASEYDGVALFSGGLDSLTGAIDLLEAGKNLVLVGHHDSPLTDSRQRELFGALRREYGNGRVTLRELYLRPASPRAGQARPLPRGIENTTRSRSFLFFAAGIAVADALAPGAPLYVPENGFIGINVPLTPVRAGSLSTRTTHPLYMHQMRVLLDQLGLGHAIENPYRLMTKGEMLQRSSNQSLLLKLAPRSISCSHPEAPRWDHRKQGNCGYCFPCLIRRASMYHVGARPVPRALRLERSDRRWPAGTVEQTRAFAPCRDGEPRHAGAHRRRPSERANPRRGDRGVLRPLLPWAWGASPVA